MHGTVRLMSWSRGSSGFSTQWTVPLQPNGVAGPRGGFGVVGAKIADVYPDPGDEVLFTTVAGDLFIFSAGGSLLMRTHVPGPLGMYNSIVVDDLWGGPDPEIYLAGAYGVYRFATAADLIP